MVASKIKNLIWRQPGTPPARHTSAPARPRHRRQRASTIANLGARSRKNTKKLNLNLTLLLSHDIWARDFKKALYVVGNRKNLPKRQKTSPIKGSNLAKKWSEMLKSGAKWFIVKVRYSKIMEEWPC